jgi:hypothetical protein
MFEKNELVIKKLKINTMEKVETIHFFILPGFRGRGCGSG